MIQPPRCVAETDRLWLYEMGPEDALHAYELNSDPDVMKYTGEASFETIEAARAFLLAYPDYRMNGYGRWGLKRKQDGDYIGWCGLKKHENGEIDLGFRLMKKFWNQGYATEAAMECLNYGFNELNAAYIIGRAMHQNTASIRVLEKIGMSFCKEELCNLHDAKTFKIERNEFAVA